MNDVVIRAVKTFIQAFLASWAVSGYALEKNVVIGAVAAAVSVVWNTVLQVK